MENNPTSNQPVPSPFSGILKKGIIAGIAVFLASYGGLYAAISLKPDLFIDYINPIFNSDGSRDMFFYVHPFILCFALAILWNRFRRFLPGGVLVKGLEFGAMYALVALIPVMWITYSAIDVTMVMVFTWLLYGFVQASLVGIIFAWLDEN
ncbi:MAG: hypothetical protein IPN29_09020 [Saprospiraceae bacterium]|nr:hypothetical protein [Saprospiraceae bacterium]